MLCVCVESDQKAEFEALHRATEKRLTGTRTPRPRKERRFHVPQVPSHKALHATRQDTKPSVKSMRGAVQPAVVVVEALRNAAVGCSAVGVSENFEEGGWKSTALLAKTFDGLKELSKDASASYIRVAPHSITLHRRRGRRPRCPAPKGFAGVMFMTRVPAPPPTRARRYAPRPPSSCRSRS